MQGFLLPLCASGDCTLREAVIVSAVLRRTSLPVLHSAAALARLAGMAYSGVNSFFIRVNAAMSGDTSPHSTLCCCCQVGTQHHATSAYLMFSEHPAEETRYILIEGHVDFEVLLPYFVDKKCASADMSPHELAAPGLEMGSLAVEQSGVTMVAPDQDLPYALPVQVLLDKRYALPYRVVDALVDHFLSFSKEERTLPVVWHQSLLCFVQRCAAPAGSPCCRLSYLELRQDGLYTLPLLLVCPGCLTSSTHIWKVLHGTNIMRGC